MKLKEQLRKPFDCIKPETLNELSEIAENFAVGFMEWTLKNQDMEFDAESNVDGLKQLLEIYKETL